ncbi:MAG TPA: hypothetical protein PKN23_02250 [Candidatus Hydrogenedentes bacterium]|nr:hypothetical protein [Candidatus Hydrogenedentota bacterium]HQL95397.1 hypothetical protein [Candidatus Hydrogenedentota bacterium]
MVVHVVKTLLAWAGFHLASGVLFGVLFAGVSFALAGEDPSFGARFGVALGPVVALSFGVLSYYPLRKVLTPRTCLGLPFSTFLGGVAGLLIALPFLGVEGGAVFSAAGCMLGYWAGVAVLGLELPGHRRA